MTNEVKERRKEGLDTCNNPVLLDCVAVSFSEVR